MRAQADAAMTAVRVPWRDRMFGAVFARWPDLGPRLARWESAALGPSAHAESMQAPIYIAGVARAGSTMLLEALSALPGGTAHRYADAALIWTPYWWNWWRQRTRWTAPRPSERAHRDRIAVTDESPEAYEEIFWMQRYPWLHQGQRDEAFAADFADAEFEAALREHVRKLLWVRGARRYVCKGNAHLTRLAFVRRIFPTARFVVPVRAPLAHVASLVKQDRLFTEMARDNPAVVTQLRRVGHYEFGPHKRAVHLGDGAEFAAIEASWRSGATAQGYARLWSTLYAHTLNTLAADAGLRAATLLLRYEDLCADPATSLSRLAEHIGIATPAASAWVAQWAGRFAAPVYYQPEFDAAQVADIAALTQATAARLGYASAAAEHGNAPLGG